jgi:glucose/arabinose dehydrogenase
MALVLVASACSHHKRFTAQRVVSSPTPIAGLETPLPGSPSPSPRTASRSSGKVSFATPTPPPPVRAGSLANARITLTRVATLSEPLAMAERAGDPALYIAEKGGTIHAIRNGSVDPAPVLNVSAEVSNGSEQGLLGLAFSSDGSKLYVNFTSKTGSGAAGNTIVREYGFAGGRAVLTSTRDVLNEPQPFANHNGGNLVFGPDGYLYIGLGDGGSGGDPFNNAQSLNTRLGKMLRLDPAPGTPSCGAGSYRIPPGNPFVGKAGCDEIWAYGLRNPWRYSFDRATGDLWIADVGQNAWEEVDFQSASSKGGDNYGWNRMEGTHSYNGGTAPPNHHGPVYEYSHDNGNCSVTGGYVYRGTRIANLGGAYVFGDYCAGLLRAFVLRNGGATEHRFLGPQVSQLSSFGQDQSGELYALSLDGGVFRIDPA